LSKLLKPNINLFSCDSDCLSHSSTPLYIVFRGHVDTFKIWREVGGSLVVSAHPRGINQLFVPLPLHPMAMEWLLEEVNPILRRLEDRCSSFGV
jgi:hypothetical protein